MDRHYHIDECLELHAVDEDNNAHLDCVEVPDSIVARQVRLQKEQENLAIDLQDLRSQQKPKSRR